MDKTITLFNLMTFVVAILALLVAGWNMWLSQIRRGHIYLSQPTIFFFGWDGIGDYTPKIMFRSALFSSGNRGRILESLHLVVKSTGTVSEFPFWGYDDGKGMVKGSGLFVGSTGHIAYHHFTPGSDDDAFSFSDRKYEIEVWAKLFGKLANVKLGHYNFEIPEQSSVLSLSEKEIGIMWNWSPAQRKYSPEISYRPVID